MSTGAKRKWAAEATAAAAAAEAAAKKVFFFFAWLRFWLGSLCFARSLPRSLFLFFSSLLSLSHSFSLPSPEAEAAQISGRCRSHRSFLLVVAVRCNRRRSCYIFCFLVFVFYGKEKNQSEVRKKEEKKDSKKKKKEKVKLTSRLLLLLQSTLLRHSSFFFLSDIRKKRGSEKKGRKW